MKRWYLLLPFLFSTAPVLTLYASNSGQASFGEALLPHRCRHRSHVDLAAGGGGGSSAARYERRWRYRYSGGWCSRTATLATIIGKFPIAGHNPANYKFLLPVTLLWHS